MGGDLNKSKRAVYSQLADYCRQRSGNVTKGEQMGGDLNSAANEESNWLPYPAAMERSGMAT